MYRLFIAIDLTGSAKEAVSGICVGIPGVKWVDPAQMHLTLRFIGDADETLFLRIRTELATISAPSFQMRLRGVGTFPPKRNPHVLWVGVDRCEPVNQLQDQVERALVRTGLEPEGRAFSPHITLARLRDMPIVRVAPYLEQHRQFETPPFPVTEFHLYSSTLTAKGAVHKREASYFLV
ncbi:MAG: RNA 2',3'-cyclic phosphodiesterase [Geobacteraceae bacterium]|nr:RNA 2',3'-cyclic phosphodiesterase [Geobacteraceae bacterium]